MSKICCIWLEFWDYVVRYHGQLNKLAPLALYRILSILHESVRTSIDVYITVHGDNEGIVHFQLMN